MLAADFDDHDTIGRWMAHHLAELVIAAQDETTTTVEQRQRIVATILKVWSHRRAYPSRAPLDDFSNVFAALERLGDDSPWKFLRPFDAHIEMLEPSTVGLPLVSTAAELERLTRETTIRLIWLAIRDAKEKNREWLELADKVASNIESEVTTALERLYRLVARQRLDAEEDDPRNVIDIPSETRDDGAAGGAEGVANDIVEKDCEDSVEDPFDDEDDDTSNPLSDISHVKHLRAMADVLNKIADALSVQVS